jgi:hypothetical protein
LFGSISHSLSCVGHHLAECVLNDGVSVHFR